MDGYTHVAHLVVDTTEVPFGQATMSGLRSMQPPVAKPAQPTARGAEKVTSSGNGAADTLGRARDMSSSMPGSEKVAELPLGVLWQRATGTVGSRRAGIERESFMMSWGCRVW